MTDRDRLAEIRAHHQAYLTAEEATAEWLALGAARPTVSPPGVAWYEWYGSDVADLLAEVERLRQGDEFSRMHAEMVGLHRGLEVKEAEVERLKGLLRRLEWAGRDGLWLSCPACNGHQRSGHVGIGPERADCWLAAEL